MSMWDEGCRLAEDGFNHADLHSRRVETGECTPIVDDEAGAYHVGTTIDCSSLRQPSSENEPSQP